MPTKAPPEEPPPEVPPPRTLQIVRRPRVRAPPTAVVGFEVLTIPQPASRPGTAEGAGEEGAGEEAAAVPPPAEGEEGVGEEGAAGGALVPTKQTRWLLAPRATAHLQLRFAAPAVGRTMRSFRFEVMGVGEGKNAAAIQGSGLCAEPLISADYRNVFSRKVKVREPLRVRRQYVIARGAFEFGRCSRSSRRRRRPRTAPSRRRTPSTPSSSTSRTTASSRSPSPSPLPTAASRSTRTCRSPASPPSRRRRRPSPARAAARAAAGQGASPEPGAAPSGRGGGHAPAADVFRRGLLPVDADAHAGAGGDAGAPGLGVPRYGRPLLRRRSCAR